MRGALLVVVLGLAAIAVFWGGQVWSAIHPSYATQVFRASTFEARYPADWDEPYSADGEWAFINYWRYDKPHSRWDAARFRMVILDRGTAFASLDELVADIQKKEDRRRPVETWRLANGLSVRTWTSWETFGEATQVFRTMVFQAPNRRFYEATYHLPQDWRIVRRYDRFFRNILASLQFSVSTRT